MQDRLSILSITISTPLGKMIACATEEGICLLEFEDCIRLERHIVNLKKFLKREIEEGENNFLNLLRCELNEYFKGKRIYFDVPLYFVGTEFQKKVWHALMSIKYGTTVSYMQLAEKLDNRLAIRAVAAANGSNKIAILVPCHRVIGSNGDLTGYAGGLWRKKYLLEMEGNLSGGQTSLLFD